MAYGNATGQKESIIVAYFSHTILPQTLLYYLREGKLSDYFRNYFLAHSNADRKAQTNMVGTNTFQLSHDEKQDRYRLVLGPLHEGSHLNHMKPFGKDPSKPTALQASCRLLAEAIYAQERLDDGTTVSKEERITALMDNITMKLD